MCGRHEKSENGDDKRNSVLCAQGVRQECDHSFAEGGEAPKKRKTEEKGSEQKSEKNDMNRVFFFYKSNWI